jgi:hypothetical protein
MFLGSRKSGDTATKPAAKMTTRPTETSLRIVLDFILDFIGNSILEEMSGGFCSALQRFA